MESMLRFTTFASRRVNNMTNQKFQNLVMVNTASQITISAQLEPVSIFVWIYFCSCNRCCNKSRISLIVWQIIITGTTFLNKSLKLLKMTFSRTQLLPFIARLEKVEQVLLLYATYSIPKCSIMWKMQLLTMMRQELKIRRL